MTQRRVAGNTRPRPATFAEHRVALNGPRCGRSRRGHSLFYDANVVDPFHPIEGGSSNNYDYVNADPVNNQDLAGTICWSCHYKKLKKYAPKGISWAAGKSASLAAGLSKGFAEGGKALLGAGVSQAVADAWVHLSLKQRLGRVLLSGVIAVGSGMAIAAFVGSCGVTFGLTCALAAGALAYGVHVTAGRYVARRAGFGNGF